MNLDTSSLSIDPILAKQLLADGALLIIAGLPVGTEFGIDLCSYTVGPDFKGVKMIPPGVHFIWTSAKGPYDDIAPRTGLVHFFHTKEVFVREWDSVNEELKARQIADAELEKERIRENLSSLDRFLAPYDLRHLASWRHLTDTITEQTVTKCKPKCEIIRTNIELESCSNEKRPRGPIKSLSMHTVNQVVNEEDLLPNLKPIEGTAPRFTKVPTRIPDNATPSEISKHSLDCIEAVEIFVKSFSNVNELIEEIQISFVFFLNGHSIEALDHWRKILNLLTHSETAVEKYKLFYMKYSEVLSFQLPLIAEELTEPTERNTIYKDIKLLLTNLYLGSLTLSADRLSKKLRKSLKWYFENLLDEDPEDMPVIVESI